MYVENMTREEITRKFMGDVEELYNNVEKRKAKALKRPTIGRRVYPYNFLFHITSKKSNSYIVCTNCPNKHAYSISFYALYKDKFGHLCLYGIVLNRDLFFKGLIKVYGICVFPYHYLKRYRERMNLNSTELDGINYFCKQETGFFPVDDYIDETRNDTVMYTSVSGCSFVKVNDANYTYVIFKTFINNESMTKVKDIYNQQYDKLRAESVEEIPAHLRYAYEMGIPSRS